MAKVELVNSPRETSSLPRTLDLDLDFSVCLGQPLTLVASSLHLRTPFIFQSEWNVRMVTWNTRSLLENLVKLSRDAASPALSPPALCADWLATAPLSQRSPAIRIIEEHKHQLRIKCGRLEKAD